MENTYHLPISPGHPRQLARGWLTLGIFALAASGLFSILIVLARTPGFQDIIPWQDFFRTALVVHVDLSVLVWFLALAGVIWTLNTRSRGYLFGRAALWLTTLGTVGLIAAPFSGESLPLMNNYVPILRNPVFFSGLTLVGIGFSVLILRSLISPIRLGFSTSQGALSLGAYASTITAAVSVICLIWSAQQLDSSLDGHAYYELLFWGAGHALQFTHTVLLLLTWLWLTHTSTKRFSPRLVGTLFLLTALPVVYALLIYLNHEVISAEHRASFTELMRYGGLASLPLGLVALLSILKPGRANATTPPIRNALWASIVLFAMGGILAFMIDGINVVIPAHYHGSIVGVTLAFMGLTYFLLPKLGYRPPAPRLASWQPWVYAGGQLMHILGLAWSGGYGVKRKTAGAAQGLDSLPEIAGMAMMGLGGLIAIVGGILFIVVAIKSMWPLSKD